MFAAVFIPNFSLQAVLRSDPGLRSRAIALVDPGLPKPVIVQLTPTARSFGVAEGLTASQAMARCGELMIKARSLPQEQTATDVLWQTAYAFSPRIEATAPGVCTMELKGLNLSFNQDSIGPWTANILQALASFHLDAQIGLAITPELALFAARTANPMLAIQNPSEFISGLPVAALEPPPDTLEILQRWGIQTIGALVALGPDRVAERLGPAVRELFNRIATTSARPLKLIDPPAEFIEQMDFENEIETIEPLLFVLRRFVEQLTRRLESIYLVVAEFQLRLGLASGVNYERSFKIPAPTGNIETLFRMLHTHLETLRTDSPIVSLRLGARPSLPETHQFGLFETALRDPNQFAETLVRLMALCGPDRVGTPQPEATHRPDAFRMKVGVHALACPPSTLKREHQQPGPPLRRFRPAIAAHVEFRNHRPALLRSPAFTGAIAEARGPFLSSGDWWDTGRWAREEWDVQTSDGSLFRIYRATEGCFVEGVYD